MRGAAHNTAIHQTGESDKTLLLEGARWTLEVEPASGSAGLRTPDGRPLFRFPVGARILFSPGEEETSPPFRTEQTGDDTLALVSRGSDFSRHVVEFEARARFLVMRFRGEAARPVRVRETRLLSRNGRGAELRDLLEGFSPSPLHGRNGEDALFSMTPRAGTEDSYFTPPPLLLGLHMPAGWVGVGLQCLPDATGVGLTSAWEVIADQPGGHVETPGGGAYCAPPLLFVFGEDPWELLEEYRCALVELGETPAHRGEPGAMPDWWKAPLYCTYGDQILEMQPHWCTDLDWAHPAYTSEWVREKVEALERRLGWSGFTVVIDAFWTDPWNADPVPSERFADLPGLIAWLHKRGHRVLLWYFPFHTALTGGRGRLAREFDVLEPGTPVDAREGRIDTTAPGFRAYAAELCRRMFTRDGLDADGLKLDFLFRLRDPLTARYQRPEMGTGLREARLWLEVFGEEARRLRPDVLLNWSAAAPQVDGLFASNRTHDVHTDPLEFQRRARICAIACPGTPVNMDGCLMRADWVEEAYLAATVYGIPSLYYSRRFHGSEPVSEETMRILSALFQLAAQKPWGQARFLDYGRWRLESHGRVVGESIEGRALILFPSASEGRILCLDSKRRRLPLHGRLLTDIEPRPGALMVRDGHLEADWVRGVVYRLTVKEE